jgi:predicted ATP-grasp superfamily ATP-dependent carboligase
MIDIDTQTPALLVKTSPYPVHAGSVGAVRSLGELGVPVHAVTEDHLTPVALSRWTTGHVLLGDAGPRADEERVEQLCAVGRALGRPAVAVAVDDGAAVLLAEHADRLRPYLLLPAVDPGLPRRLASKRELAAMCAAYGVPTPRTAFPEGPAGLLPAARELGFPLVAKNAGVGGTPIVPGTTLIADAAELMRRFGGRADLSGLLLQEHLPFDGTNDWFVHAYCGADARPLVAFVGRKAYAWPPGRGITTDARSAESPVLRELTAGLVRRIGYRGVLDCDWRYDPRDGRFKLVDFNPRVGAQFRFGVTRGGVDVIRALHLDLTGRPVPAGEQDLSRRLVVENVHLPAVLRHRMSGLPRPAPVRVGLHTHGAWREGGLRDPLPVLAMAARTTGRLLAAAGRRALPRFRAVTVGPEVVTDI